MGKLNPFRTKEYGGWGGADPGKADENRLSDLREGQKAAAAARVVRDCRKCTPRSACGKHVHQWQTAQGAR